MKWPGRLVCIVRGGHKWENVEDPAGSFSRCARCGTLDRRGAGSLDRELSRAKEEGKANEF
jgi:hypothetical protein